MERICRSLRQIQFVALVFIVGMNSFLAAIDVQVAGAPATNSPLHFGDSLCLYQQGMRNDFYFAAKTTDAGILSQAIGQSSADASTKIYIQPGLAPTRWTGCGANMPVKNGDFVRLEIASLANTASPAYLAYDFSAAATTKFFSAAFSTNASNVAPAVSLISLAPNSGYVFKIFKINTTSIDPIIYAGDNIVLMAYTNKTGAGLAPLFFGAQKSDDPNAAQGEATVFASCTGANSYPADFPNNYCWFVSSLTVNAFNSDRLNVASAISGVGDAALVTQQDVSAWPTQNPNFATISPPITVIMKYGDGFAVKHKTYGFYASTNGGNSYNPCFGTMAMSNTTKFLIMPYNVQTNGIVMKWGDGTGGSLLGKPIKSGDIIVFSDYNGDFAGFEHNAYKANPTVSTPSPPYYAVNSCSDGCSRIFKMGGRVGDPIYYTDDFYVVHLWGQSNQNPSPAFLGSSNKDWSPNKEMFWYYPSSTLPPNFSRVFSGFPPDFSINFLWNFDQYQPAVYSRFPKYATNTAFNPTFGPAWYSYWSPWFVAGGAKYVEPNLLQQ